MVLSGCSFLKLGYTQLPEVSIWWLDNYLNFTDSQSAQAKTALKKLLAWHRKEELPAVADLLAQAQSLASDNISSEQACRLWDIAQQRIEALLNESARDAAPVAAQLSPRQLKHIQRQWDSKNQDWQKDWLLAPPEDRKKKRLDSAVDRYSSFYGDFSPAQIKLIEQQQAQSPWSPQWAWQQRLQRQQEQMVLMQSWIADGAKPALSVPEVEKSLKAFLQLSARPSQASELTKQLQIEQHVCQNLAQLHNSTSPAQRLKAQRKLKSYESDLRDLVKQVD